MKSSSKHRAELLTTKVMGESGSTYSPRLSFVRVPAQPNLYDEGSLFSRLADAEKGRSSDVLTFC